MKKLLSNHDLLFKFISTFLALSIIAIGTILWMSELSSLPVIISVTILLLGLIYLSYLWYARLLNQNKSLSHRVNDNVQSYLFNNGDIDQKDVLEGLNQRLVEAKEFIKHIGDGSYETEYPGMTQEILQFNQETLSGELISMRDKMRHVAEEEKRRNWINAGLAKFSEILRNDNKEISEICDHLISELTKYLNANQGKIFIIQGDEQNDLHLKLFGTYAYGRKKFLDQKIYPGEGLTGQAFIEKDKIFLTDVPNNYVRITSGLGDALPKCVIIIPLINKDQVEGVIEIASFKIIQQFEIEFLEKIAENAAAFLSNIKVNELTKKLLTESQESEEQMRAQEEELRQNMEELSSTQEEMDRKSREAIAQNNKMNAILEAAVDGIITITQQGVIESVNKACGSIFGYSEEEMIGNNVAMLMPENHASKHDGYLAHHHETGERKVIGQTRQLDGKKKDGTIFPIELSVNPMQVNGEAMFAGIVRDITARVEMESERLQYVEELKATEEQLNQHVEELRAQQDEIETQFKEITNQKRELDARMLVLNESTIVSEANLYGDILFINDKFCEVSQYSREELIGQPHKIVRHEDTPSIVFKNMWATIKAGKVFRGIVKNKCKDGSHYWVDAVIAPVLDDNGKPMKYIGVRYVIEQEDIAQNLFDVQNEKLLKVSLN